MLTNNSSLSIIREQIKSGNKTEARQLLKEYLKNYPQDAEGWYLGAQLSTNKTQAIACLERAIKIDPFHEKAVVTLEKLQSTNLNNYNPKTSNNSTFSNYRGAVIGGISLAILSIVILIVVIVSRIGQPSTSSLAAIPTPIQQTIQPTTSLQDALVTATSFQPTLPPTWTSSPVPLTKVTDIPNEGKWIIQSDKSSFDDTSKVTIFLEAESSVKSWLGNPTPVLILRCQEHQIEVYINNGTQAETEIDSDYNDRPTARFRWDKEKAFELQMDKSTDGEALFFRNPMTIINSLLVHDTLLYSFTPFNASPAETSFDIRNLSKVIQPLFTACK